MVYRVMNVSSEREHKHKILVDWYVMCRMIVAAAAAAAVAAAAAAEMIILISCNFHALTSDISHAGSCASRSDNQLGRSMTWSRR